MAFPAPDFGNQEFNDATNIKKHADANGPPSLLLFSKANVMGEDQRPVFKWVSRAAIKKGTGETFNPSWNFKGKFLVDSHGNMKQTQDVIRDVQPLFNEEGTVETGFTFSDTMNGDDSVDLKSG